MRCLPFFGLAVIALLAMQATAPGAVIQTGTSQNNGTNSLSHTYVPSAVDLINGLAPTASTGNFTVSGTGGTAVLTNGVFPSPITRDGGGAFNPAVFASGGQTLGGTSVTYTLAKPSIITGINVYGGWQDNGRDQQSYSVLYSLASDPSTFIPLTTVNFNPTGNAFPIATLMALTDTTGVLASNVAALRFNFNATENNWSGYSEIDVFGIAIPEPTTITIWSLLGLSGLGFAFWRYRGRRT